MWKLTLEAKQMKMYVCTLKNFTLVAFRVDCTGSQFEMI